METLNRQAIKEEARQFIGVERRWLTMGLACLPIALITGALQGGSQFVNQFNGDEGFHFSLSFGSGVLVWLLIPFTVAIAGFFLNHLRGNNPEWKSLYMEGIDRYVKYFKVGVVTEIITILCSFLLIVPGIIKYYEYFFVHHIIHDNPELEGSQARNLSDRITDGYKGQLFILELSFFFWRLFEALTLGIASIYVTPYVECTKAMYYENLKFIAINKGIATPEEFGIAPVTEEPFYNDYQAPVTEETAYTSYEEPVAEDVVTENETPVEEIIPDDTNTEN